MSKEGIFTEAGICLPLSSCTNQSGIYNPPPDCGTSATSNVAQKRRSSSTTASVQKHRPSTTAVSKRKLPVTTAASKRKRTGSHDSAATTILQNVNTGVEGNRS